MSILVECITVIIPQIVLDISWPGGSNAYLEAVRKPDHPCRYGLADEGLTAVSFYDPTHVDKHIAELAALGIVLSGDSDSEICILDQELGPFNDCSWLEWEIHDCGFAHAWNAGTEPGDMVMAWEGWTLEASSELKRIDIRDEPGAAMRLARDPDGTETWLNLKTGAIWSAPVSEEESAIYDLLREIAQ